MKIKNKGAGYDKHSKWWVGKTLVCDRCGCEFELEAIDGVKTVSNQFGGDYGVVACPSYHATQTFDKPRGYQGPG